MLERNINPSTEHAGWSSLTRGNYRVLRYRRSVVARSGNAQRIAAGSEPMISRQ